jgi:DNA-binding IclR family transcriptional regulator
VQYIQHACKRIDEFDMSGVQSLQRGLLVLEATINKDLSSSEAATILNVDRTTAFRLLKTLEQEGYVIQDPVLKTFRANPAKLFKLASELSSSLSWINIAQGFLRELTAKTLETSQIAVLDRTEMVYVAQQLSTEDLAVRFVLGIRRPLHCSAVGKAVIAFMEEPEINKILTEIDFVPFTPQTITSPKELKKQLGEIKAKGYAFDSEETLEGVRCIAAPFCFANSKPFGAVGISAPAFRLSDERVQDLARNVVETAEKISRALMHIPEMSVR